MVSLDLAGALKGLSVVEIGDRDRYKAAVTAGEQLGWAYYFPHLLLQNRPGRTAILVIEDRGSLCVFRWRVRGSEARVELYLPPIPASIPVTRRCLERANDYNGDRSARILHVDEKDVPILTGKRPLRFRPRRSQYLYDPSSYTDLAGGSFRTLRRQSALVEALPHVEVSPYAAEHAEACQGLLRRWSVRNRAARGNAGGAGTAARAIALAGKLPDADLRGEVVLVEGRLVAFAFGGEIRPGVGSFLEAKSDEEVPGLSYYHRRSFLLRMRDFELVNDGSDAGRAGLRQLKDSLRPVRMHVEYRAAQRRG